MKLQIDTSKKTIKIEDSVKIDTLIKTLKQMFPNNEWKSFTLETSTTINNWGSPYVIEKIREVPSFPVWRNYPWYNSVSGSMGRELSQASGTATRYSPMFALGQFNVEVK